MKYSEKLSLLLKGNSWEHITELEEQEAMEAAAAKEQEEKEEHEQTALEQATEMLKDLEAKLEAKEDELTKLNAQFAELNNKQTVKEQPEKKVDASDVMRELFNHNKKED